LNRKFTERYNFLLEASKRKGKKKQLHLRVPALNFKESGVADILEFDPRRVERVLQKSFDQ
jgi:hypothetical protein